MRGLKEKGKQFLHKLRGQQASVNGLGLYPPAVNSSESSHSQRSFNRLKTGNEGNNQSTQPPKRLANPRDPADPAVPTNTRFASDSASTHRTIPALAGEKIAAVTVTDAEITSRTTPEDSATQPSPEAIIKNEIPALWERALNDPAGLSIQERQTLQGVKLQLQHTTTKTIAVSEAFGDFMKELVDKRESKGKFTFRGVEINMADVSNKIISWVDKFKEIGDIVIQFDPVHAALPWAGFRFLLKVCVDKNKTMEAILIGLEKMTYLIDQCSLYERLYLHHDTEASTQLEAHMLRLYIAILKFLANAIDRSKDNHIQAVFTLDDVSQHLQKVEEIEKKVETYAQTVENQNTRMEFQHVKHLLGELKKMNSSLQPQLDAIQQHLEQSRRSKILRWISEIPYTEHHERISNERLEGTGKWLFERQEYSDWRHSDTSKLLLLGGIPGAGKTYTASTVIDYYLTKTTRLAYFYCNRAEEDRRDPQKILATILQQLSQTGSKEGLLTPVVKIYEDREAKGQTSAKPSLGVIRDLLIQVIDLYPETTICIDALDEVNNEMRLALLETLKNIIDRSKSVIKIFVTTRMDTDILRGFKIFPLIELQPDDNATDINHFIETKVQSFLTEKSWHDVDVEDELRGKICGALKIRCKGNFQLASLQIQLFRQLDFQEDILEALQKLPDTLVKAYDEIYQNIHSKASRSVRLALSAFRWLHCSYTQLNSEELLDVVNAEVSSTGEFGTISRMVTAETLLAVCQNLVILDKGLNVFRFAHLSVDEYLETKLSKQDSHLEIASICLGMLCTDSDSDDTDWDTWLRDSTSNSLYEPGVDEAIKKKHFLLFYAHVYWPWHLQHCKLITRGGHLISLLWDKFCAADSKSDKDTYISRWTRRSYLSQNTIKVPYSDSNGSFYDRSQAFTMYRDAFSANERILICVFTFGLFQVLQAVIDLSVDAGVKQGTLEQLLLKSSKFGDLKIVQLLIDKGANVSATNEYEDTPLHLASKWGHTNVAQLLIGKGANVGATSEYGDTPLHEASSQGHVNIAQLLIDKGADVSATNHYGSTPLHLAATQGHTNVAQLLIDRGANVCATDNHSNIPLHLASRWGHMDMARLLIGKGANVSATNEYDTTPLHEASSRGHTGLAQLLIDKGANLSPPNRYNTTPLHEASSRGHTGLAQLLIDRGANVCATSTYGNTPLHEASLRGHTDLVQMLIDKGANVCATNASGNTPLHLALSSASNEVAQVLIEQEADISAKNTRGDTPLDLARREGCDKIVQLLVNKGAIQSN